MRILCEYLKKFETGENPCRKVLCEVNGKIIEQTEDEIIVEGGGDVVLKCFGCKQKTKIVFREVMKNE